MQPKLKRIGPTNGQSDDLRSGVPCVSASGTPNDLEPSGGKTATTTQAETAISAFESIDVA